MKRILKGIILATVVVAFFSCKENSLEKQRQNELKKLNEFIRAHYAEVERKPSGLYYIELEKGTGDSIKMGDRVQVFHEIYTLDSLYVTGSGPYEPLELIVLPPTELSSSPDYVSELKALNEALTYMKKGSKARLIFDSQLGFGQYGSYGVGGFTPLMMEVEVYKVFPAPVPDEEE
ncbi:MAG: FKBP-type peptidyl-prolyl cis-trans isomerase [Mariniphaga sp.]